jgi:hypothetical protein
MRHSFGIYFYARERNEAPTAAVMGNSLDMVHRHYRRLVDEEAMKQFWALKPMSEKIFPSKKPPIDHEKQTAHQLLTIALNIT